LLPGARTPGAHLRDEEGHDGEAPQHTLLSSRLDMLFNAFSCMQSQQRFPTYAQPYVFTPHRWHSGWKVLIVPLMFKVHRLSALPLQNKRIFFCTIVQLSCFMLCPDFMFSLFVACLDSSVTILYYHLSSFQLFGRASGGLFLFWLPEQKGATCFVSTSLAEQVEGPGNLN
jgi:hypothetical protein